MVPATHLPDLALIAGRPCQSTLPSRVNSSVSSLNFTCRLISTFKRNDTFSIDMWWRMHACSYLQMKGVYIEKKEEKRVS